MIITFIDKCDYLKKVYLSSGAIFTQLKMIIKLYVQFKSEIGREIGSLTRVFLTAIYRKLHHFRKVHPLEFYFTWSKEAFYGIRIFLLDGCYVHLFLSLFFILAAGLTHILTRTEGKKFEAKNKLGVENTPLPPLQCL